MNEIIKVENLDVGYNGQIVLHQLNFSINRGDITVILGQSGCGKSTIIKTLLGILPPLNGQVFFFGQQVDYRSEKAIMALYRRVGVLYQNGALLNSLSLYENVALPLNMHYPKLEKDLEREMVHSRLAQVGLAQSAKKFPAELSGGMRKRAALARAMILDPEIIFCDEPSAGLDPITAAGLDKLMINLREHFDITFIVVTHELRSIHAISDMALVLNENRLHYFGPYEDMLKRDDPFISAFFMKDTEEQEPGHSPEG